MKYRFFIADVFTDKPFAGNQLAVLPQAEGISDVAMQSIAREFNFAETTFVLPPRDPRNACRVRIFTPKTELPFAGHPTVGTAAVLAHVGKLQPGALVLEEGIGPVPVEVARGDGLWHARFTIEKEVEVPSVRAEPAHAAAALSLPEAAVREAWYANPGVRFCFIRLPDKATVDRAVLDRAAWSRHFAQAWASNLYFFAGEKQVYVRMFAPALGIDEDPATGSAAVGIAGVLATRLPERDGVFTWHIEQGVAMGRRSTIEASAEKRDGRVAKVKVGGPTVVVAEGEMTLA
jgi:trans-2,3-dihydro-3-hydroxyanthranilate isomerase